MQRWAALLPLSSQTALQLCLLLLPFSLTRSALTPFLGSGRRIELSVEVSQRVRDTVRTDSSHRSRARVHVVRVRAQWWGPCHGREREVKRKTSIV